MSDNGLSITMLGTGNATVTKCYNTCFVLREQDRCFMVDAGGGKKILRILEEQKFGPYEKHHSTVRDICQTAQELQVKNLVLMHTEDSHIQDRKKLYTEKGGAFFSGNLWVPDDGESICLLRQMVNEGRAEENCMESKGIIAETDRLILRRYTESDLQDLFAYLSDAEVVEYEPYKPMSLEETKENLVWRIGTEEMIAVESKENHKMIGNVYMGKREFETVEMGYVFNRKYWRNGYAAESCEALIQKAFANGVHRIYAECDPDNIKSWKLLETLGFQREAHLRKNVYFWKDEKGSPIWKDTFVYAKLNGDE